MRMVLALTVERITKKQSDNFDYTQFWGYQIIKDFKNKMHVGGSIN